MPSGPARLPIAALLALLLLCAPTWADDDPLPPVVPPVVPTAPGPAKPVPPKAPLVFGTYAATAADVVDGDTIRITGQPAVRVLCVDTEETYKRPEDRAAAEANFAAYAKAMRGTHPRPRKFGTPAGEAAKVFFVELMQGVTHVRLERDELGAPEADLYGRRLAHVFLIKPTGDVLLTEALIQAGHSPYFVKYGGSARFDARFRAAEKAAREAKRGVWGTEGPAHYPDYPERLVWWHAREAQIKAWRLLRTKPDHVSLGEPTTATKLKSRVGKSVVVFGLFSRVIETRDKSRMIMFLANERRRGLPVVFFDKAEYAKLDLEALESRYITVRGSLSLYKGSPQMVVERADQISTR